VGLLFAKSAQRRSGLTPKTRDISVGAVMLVTILISKNILRIDSTRRLSRWHRNWKDFRSSLNIKRISLNKRQFSLRIVNQENRTLRKGNNLRFRSWMIRWRFWKKGMSSYKSKMNSVINFLWVPIKRQPSSMFSWRRWEKNTKRCKEHLSGSC